MNRPLTFIAVALVAALVLVASFNLAVQIAQPQTPTETPTYNYTVVNTFPHDPTAFTEGLAYADGFLYESTGLNGESSLRKVNLTSGEVLQQSDLSANYFGEGITIVNSQIIQLTYTTKVGFVYNQTSFKLLGNFSYSTQGWGLTYDGQHLIMSDGSSNLYFLDPQTFQQTGYIQVHDGNKTVTNLNELEYVNGEVYANIFEQQKIAIIDLQTGQVKGWIDLSDIVHQERTSYASVLNGIAYDQANNRLFVTGKYWHNLYEITIKP